MRIEFKNRKGEKLVGVLHKASDSSEIVVFIHGYLSSKDTSAKINSEALAELGINAFRFDLSGCGESEGDASRGTITGWVEDAEDALEMLKGRGYDRFELVGSSAGGLIAMILALKRGDITRMVLKAPVSDYIAQRTKRLGRGYVEEWKKKGYIMFPRRNKPDLKIYYDFMEDATKYVMYDKAKQIKIPTLILHGTEDEHIPVEHSEKLVQNLQNGSLVIIEGANHGLAVDGDYSFGKKLLLDWLREKN